MYVFSLGSDAMSSIVIEPLYEYNTVSEKGVVTVLVMFELELSTIVSDVT